MNQELHDLNTSNMSSLVSSIVQAAIEQKSSDIHIEPSKNKIILRFRTDGQLAVKKHLDISILSNLLSYLKIKSNLDIAEFRLPKDGSFKIDEISDIDFRISILPTIFGEKVVIRLIYKDTIDLDLNNNGIFYEKDIIIIKNMLRKNGCVLVTGPTGSGKTTSLSSFLSFLNKENVNITTIEDPVENILPRVNHVSLNSKIGIDFGMLLKHILRQDPDIIMIGEIRDEETAQIVVRSSITGHLVLSTLHTNDAISTISRLVDMGVEKYLLLEALNGIISQRLVRRLCTACKEKTQATSWIQEQYNISEVYQPIGCEKCSGTGYKGRFAIYEILYLTKEIKHNISQNNIEQIHYTTIKENAINEILLGNTSLNEVYSILLDL